MKKTVLFLLALALIMSLLCACGESVIKKLPEDAQNIVTAEYTNPDNADDGYAGVIEYGGRTYVIYGTQSGTIRESMIKECIGYTDGDTNSRVYTLNDTDDYIATYYVNGEMEQLTFLRALDTRGEDIDTPEYISSLDYELWK